MKPLIGSVLRPLPLALIALAGLSTGACAQQNQGDPAPAPQAPAQAEAAQSITVTVAPGARQAFGGLGTSIGNWGRDYQKLSAAERLSLSKMLWGDLKMKTIRLWQNLNEFQAEPGAHDISDFRARYIDSNLIADAQAQGVTNILLGPDAMPAHLKAKREGGGADYALRDDSIEAYGAVIADFIKQVRDEAGVVITATGVQNEPNDLDRISPEQMPRVIKALRAALDARGLKQVQIIGPEAANVDGIFYDTLDRIKADAEAWKALDGIASHSYGMAATDEAAKRIAGAGGENLKPYWQTESSANGAEAPGDAIQAASLAARFLSDMNHRVTHWVHFLGFEAPDPNDNATRIIAYQAAPLRPVVFQKYFYYRQLARTFDVGAAFRQSQSSLEGEMTWTYGPKPRVTVAAARNPDGSWGIGLSNFTAPDFLEVPKENNGGDFFNGYRARTFEVTVEVPELAQAGTMRFELRRSNATINDQAQQIVLMKNGRATVTLNPLDLVTLRSVQALPQGMPQTMPQGATPGAAPKVKRGM